LSGPNPPSSLGRKKTTPVPPRHTSWSRCTRPACGSSWPFTTPPSSVQSGTRSLPDASPPSTGALLVGYSSDPAPDSAEVNKTHRHVRTRTRAHTHAHPPTYSRTPQAQVSTNTRVCALAFPDGSLKKKAESLADPYVMLKQLATGPHSVCREGAPPPSRA